MKTKNVLMYRLFVALFSLGFGTRGEELFAQTWTGGYSTDWNNPCNWNTITVPTCAGTVIIPGGTTFQPTISGGQTGYCATIDINSAAGAMLTINTSAGGALTEVCNTVPACPSPCTMNIYPEADTRVRRQGNENINYGTEGYMSTESNSGNGPWLDISMMRFSLTGIPLGATITAATLNVYLYQTSPSSTFPFCGYDQPINVSAYHFADIAWVENTVTWNTRPAGLPGTVQSTLNLSSTPGYKSFSLVLATVQSYLATGAVSYSLQGADFAGSSGKCYATKESCTASEYLSVTFTY